MDDITDLAEKPAMHVRIFISLKKNFAAIYNQMAIDPHLHTLRRTTYYNTRDNVLS